jgi:hypothetical protein
VDWVVVVVVVTVVVVVVVVVVTVVVVSGMLQRGPVQSCLHSHCGRVALTVQMPRLKQYSKQTESRRRTQFDEARIDCRMMNPIELARISFSRDEHETKEEAVVGLFE